MGPHNQPESSCSSAHPQPRQRARTYEVTVGDVSDGGTAGPPSPLRLQPSHASLETIDGIGDVLMMPHNDDPPHLTPHAHGNEDHDASPENNNSCMPNDSEVQQKPLTLFGYPVHLAFVRTYTPPLDVDWSQHSFDTYYGLLYKDPVVADQFRAFYFRSFLSFTVGTLYSFGFLLVAAFPIITRQYTAMWAIASAVLFTAMSMDMVLHLFAPVTPTVAKARMVIAVLTGAMPSIASGWSAFAVMTECEDVWGLPNFQGRINLSVEAQRRLCVQLFEPYQVAAITLGTLGVILYPIPHFFITVLHFVLSFVVARAVATGPFAHEQPSEIAVEALMLLVCDFGAMAITFVRFTAGRAAFEATIKVEVQRREASARATELQQLLNTIVPVAVLPRLEAGGADQFQIDSALSASMLFADMKGFTAWSSSRSAEAVTSMLNTVVAALDALAVRTEAVDKIKTVGDAYWAVSGIPVEAQNHADQLVLFGWRLNEMVAELSAAHAEWDDITWRVGIHTGPMTGALFGERQVSYEVFGETAQIAQIVESNGVPGSVVVTQQTVAALLLRPDDKYLRAHDTLTGLGPSGGVLTLYEILKPQDGTDSHQTAMTSLISTPVVTPLLGRPGGTLLLPHSHSLTFSAPPSSRGSASVKASGSDSATVTPGGQHHHQVPRRRPKPARSIRLLVSTSLVVSEKESGTPADEAAFDDAALAALEVTQYPLLPYYENADTEAHFKQRTEKACRNMTRVCAVFMLLTHGLHMSTLLAMPNRCFAVIGSTLQFLALLPHTIAIVFAFHPQLSLQVSMTAMLLAASVGIIGTGLTPLNGCEVGHDLQVYCFITFAVIFSATGPISWPVLSAVLFSTVAFPAVILNLFFSPVAFAAVAYIPLSGVMGAALAFIVERLLRRQFIEEELAKRGELKLGLLAEQRVEVLQRLVPKHIVSDLIEWFGTKMDPAKSITRSYRRVVIAFMRLRPEAIVDLPRLHAEVDEDLMSLQNSNGSSTRSEFTQCSNDAEADPVSLTTSPPQTSTLDKIKTVGDVVMVAGPFPSTSKCTDIHVTDEEVISSFVAVVQLFIKVRAKCPVQVGMHMGPVVGTVQGSSRLAFDVFGDPVNVASRVLAGAAETDSSLHVSAALAGFVESGAPSGTAPQFGAPVTVAAKGKGVLEIQRVQA